MYIFCLIKFYITQKTKSVFVLYTTREPDGYGINTKRGNYLFGLYWHESNFFLNFIGETTLARKTTQA